MRRSECSSITTETILSKPLEQLRFHNRRRLPIRQATAVPGGVVGDQVWGEGRPSTLDVGQLLQEHPNASDGAL